MEMKTTNFPKISLTFRDILIYHKLKIAGTPIGAIIVVISLLRKPVLLLIRQFSSIIGRINSLRGLICRVFQFILERRVALRAFIIIICRYNIVFVGYVEVYAAICGFITPLIRALYWNTWWYTREVTLPPRNSSKMTQSTGFQVGFPDEAIEVGNLVGRSIVRRDIEDGMGVFVRKINFLYTKFPMPMQFLKIVDIPKPFIIE